jgi:hypothetical protein
MLLVSSIVLALITLAIAIFAQVKKVTLWGLVMVMAMCGTSSLMSGIGRHSMFSCCIGWHMQDAIARDFEHHFAFNRTG